MHPVVVGRVSVALLHHQTEPEGGARQQGEKFTSRQQSHDLGFTAGRREAVRPGQSVHVDLVRVDESHVFEHAEDALRTHAHTHNQLHPFATLKLY